jgi:WD40 repeat protein/tRNA A-37 threonylcarbamoyl transferase component Bud32
MAVVISRKYEVLDLLGQGGMGIVYKVRHMALDAIYALKALPREFMEQPEMVRRFYREARLMAQLLHPNIVPVFDVGQDDAIPCHYFVMEYLRGRNLRQYLRDKGPLPLLEVLDIARQVAKALSYAHLHNPPVIHRDIKPSNIMVEEGSSRVVVMDFGIAKELDRGEMTKSGMVLGTLHYCAPEQLRNEPLDGATDIYALGMVMYEAYEGKPFFAELAEHEVIARLLSESEENQPRFVRPTPPAFVSLVTRAIAKSRVRRYPNVDALLHDLEVCWSMLEDTKTVAISSTMRREDSPLTLEPPGEMEELEEQIRRLEEERQKRRVVAAQTQTRERREQAVKEGGGRWATAIFQQGLGCEEQGHAFLRAGDYESAQAAYQEAMAFFTQARQEAKAAALIHQAEQARQDMTTAKTEAERYGARERARTFYGRGLALQAQADECWSKHDYEKAKQFYTEACSSFEDARELAYRLGLKVAAETAREEMQYVRTQAVQEGAEDFAVPALPEAASIQRRAEFALGHEEFTQARELYAAARQQYEVAREQALAARTAREAELAHLRQQAALAHQRVQEVQSRAQREGAQVRLPSAFARAEQLLKQGTEHEKRGEAAEAARVYDQAAAKFAELHRETLRLAHLELQRQRHAALAAKQQVLALQQIVEEETLSQSMYELLHRGHEAKQKAEQAAAAEQWDEAATEFTRASASFTEILVRLTEEVRQEAAAFRAEAERMGAREKAAALYEQGITLEAQATLSWEAAAYQQARQGYREARAIFAQAREQARQEHRQEQARQVRAKAVTLRETLKQEGVDTLVPASFRDAWTQEQQGDAALRERNFALATDLYEAAKQQYESARQHAALEQQRRRALAAREQAQRKRVEAEAARVRPDHSRRQQALEAQQRGETALAAGHYEQAVLEYEQTSDCFVQAIQQCELERRQQAETARLQMQLAKEKVTTVENHAAARWAEAQAEEQQAELDYQAQRYDEAKTQYERARRSYEAAAEEAVYEHLQQQALQAKQRADASRNQISELIPSDSDRWFNIQKLEAEAQAAWGSKDYQKACAFYEQLRRQYERLQQEEKEEQRRRPALAAQQQAELAQQEATTAEAQQYATGLFQEASEAKQQGEVRLRAKQWEEANERFSRASELFVQARYDARLTKARLAAEAARSQALAAQRDVAVEDGETLFPGRLEDATERLREAEEAFARLEFGAARKKFLESVSLFSHIHHDTLRGRQREHTEQAREQAFLLRNNITVLLEPYKQQVEQTLVKGEQLFQQRQYVEAQACYTEASTLLTSLHGAHAPTSNKAEMWGASSRRLVAAAITLLLVAILNVYFLRRAPSREGQDSAKEELSPQLPETGQPLSVTPAESSDSLASGQAVASREVNKDEVPGRATLNTPDSLLQTQQNSTAVSIPQEQPSNQKAGLPQLEWRAATEEGYTHLLFREKVAQQEEPTRLATLPEAGKAQLQEKNMKPPLLPSGPLLKLPPLRLVMANPVLELQAPIPDVALAFLDDRSVRLAPGGVIQETLPHLPIGDSLHKLVLVNAAAKAQEAPLTLSYYPRWEMRQMRDGLNEVYFVTFSPDGRFILAGSRDKTLKLWDVKDGRKLRTFVGHADWVNGVAFAPDAKVAASGSDDKTVRIWDIKTGQSVRVLTGHTGVVHAVAFSPDGGKIISASSDGVLKLWDAKTGAELRTLTGHTNWIWTATFSPDGHMILSGSEDKTVKLWSVDSGQELRTLSGHSRGVTAVAFSPDGQTLLSGGSDGMLRLWRAADGKLVRAWSAHSERINSVAFSPDGKMIISASKDKMLKLWEAKTGQLLRTFIGHEATVIGAAFSPNGQIVASGSRDKTIRVWWGGSPSGEGAAD